MFSNCIMRKTINILGVAAIGIMAVTGCVAPQERGVNSGDAGGVARFKPFQDTPVSDLQWVDDRSEYYQKRGVSSGEARRNGRWDFRRATGRFPED